VQKKLFETIRLENGHFFNLKWHNQRLNRSRLKLFGATNKILLEDFLPPPFHGSLRCRVVYSYEIESIELFPYTPKEFSSFKIVPSNIDYSYKYDNRQELQNLLDPSFDEIIIEKDGILTDTSIANIAFYDGKDWFTPTTPLLAGTTRARLLDEGFLKLKNIKKENIKNYSYFALMNAMIGFQIQKSIHLIKQ